MYRVALEDDCSCTNETDTRNHLRRYTRHIQTVAISKHHVIKAMGRQDHEHRRSQGN